MAGPAWYALRTRARSEKKAARILAARGIQSYCPVIRKERRWADRTRTVRFPMFPGYVFARFPPGRLLDVLQASGVVGVVRTGGTPTAVRPDELEAVRLLERGVAEAGGEPRLEESLKPGDPVEVASGPFAGMRGSLVRRRGRSRVQVTLTAIGQAVSVVLPGEILRPLPERPA